MTNIKQELDYENDTKIDRDRLEECLTEQAELRAKWAKAWAIAVKDHDLAKEHLDLTMSELSRDARKNWETLDFPKAPTDGMVKEWLPSQEEYKEASTYLIEAAFKMNVLGGKAGNVGPKAAFDDRSRALSDLVKLWLNGYYADDHMVGKEARDLLNDIRKEEHIEQLNKTDQRTKLKRRK